MPRTARVRSALLALTAGLFAATLGAQSSPDAAAIDRLLRAEADSGFSGVVLVAAHGNSLRALIKHLDGLSDDAVVGLNVPTGIPLHYELDDTTLMPSAPGTYLDPEAAATAIEAVANQGRK